MTEKTKKVSQLQPADTLTGDEIMHLVQVGNSRRTTINNVSLFVIAALTSTFDAITAALGNKVDKVLGKGLSTEDFTTEEKSKLAGIEEGAQASRQLAYMNVPVGISCTFTGTTDGNITLSTPLNYKIPGCFFYYPADSLSASHSAGFYWTEFSDTSNAIVYQEMYVPGPSSEPMEPTAKTPFSGTVPGGTGVTDEVTCFSFQLLAGLLGKNGGIESAIQTEFCYISGTKANRIRLNNDVVGIQYSNVSPILNGVHRFKNIGSESVQRGSVLTNGAGATTSYYTEQDTSIDSTVSITLSKSDPAEWGFLFYYSAMLFK